MVNGDLAKPGEAQDQADALSSWIKKGAQGQKYFVTSLVKQPLNLI